MLLLKPPYNILHFINILLSPNICTFWDTETFNIHTPFFLHFQIWPFWPQKPKNSNLANSFLMHYPQPKMNQKSQNDPKSILILTMKLLYTYFWKMLSVGALIWLALIWLIWAQITQPTSNHLKTTLTPCQIITRRSIVDQLHRCVSLDQEVCFQVLVEEIKFSWNLLKSKYKRKLWPPFNSSPGGELQNQLHFCVSLSQEIRFQVPVEEFKSHRVLPNFQGWTLAAPELTCESVWDEVLSCRCTMLTADSLLESLVCFMSHN